MLNLIDDFLTSNRSAYGNDFVREYNAVLTEMSNIRCRMSSLAMAQQVAESINNVQNRAPRTILNYVNEYIKCGGFLPDMRGKRERG